MTAAGVITGAVDDGDGIFENDDGDCKIDHGSIDADTCEIAFDQEYSDGAVTHWKCRYDPETGALVDGEWSGECTGTFVAQRKVDKRGSKRTPAIHITMRFTGISLRRWLLVQSTSRSRTRLGTRRGIG